MKYFFSLLLITLIANGCDTFHRHCDGEFEHNFFHYIQALDTLQANDFNQICVNDAACEHVLLHMKESVMADLPEDAPMEEKEQTVTQFREELLTQWNTKRQHRDTMFQRVIAEGKKYNVKWSEMKLLTYGRIEQETYGIEKNKGEVMFKNETYSFVLPFEALLINDQWKISDLGKLQKRKLQKRKG